MLLIKAAWGGRSLCKPFRPPSAGLPSDEVLRRVDQAQERVRKNNEKNKKEDRSRRWTRSKEGYGSDYRARC
ncbi:MAG: hypothetical protein R3F11_30910 [Verrucomicrobiales bacterium]